MPSSYADLEIGLRRLDGDSMTVGIRFSPPGSDGDVRLGDDTALTFDLTKLKELRDNAAEYGTVLSTSLFTGGVAEAFANARREAASQNTPLRLRLLIAPTVEHLHSVRWETLRDPDHDASLLASEQVLFSRYLTSRDWRPVGLAPKSDLDALIVVANPTGLEDRGLAPVDVDGELKRAQAGLGQMPVTTLASGGKATLAGLLDTLHGVEDDPVRRGGPEVLYLVCHGLLVNDEPQLMLENEDGTVDRVTGGEFLAGLANLPSLPRLIVLASCQSAGTGGSSADEGALAGLGPRLAELGVPAVVAMQGNVTMQTIETFMPAFFSELDRDGQIDRAMAVARGKVLDRPDWWMPVLFMRLQSGRLWYVPGFAGGGDAYERWPSLLGKIAEGKCLPILGPSLSDSLLGPSERLARSWADEYKFPMSAHDEEDLADVAQFLRAIQDPEFPVGQLRTYLEQKFAEYLPKGSQPPPAALDTIITSIWENRPKTDPMEPYTTLARMPFPIYLTTEPVGLLTAALKAEGKDPKVDYCRWNVSVDWPESVFDGDPNFVPTAATPLVYHLFGHLAVADSLVLTVDDYFDFLIGLTANKASIPKPVLSGLAKQMLFFLGFRVDDWAFRVVFRTIMNLQGAGRSKVKHVAAQIDPEGSRIQSPDGARHYLEKYLDWFDVDLYWGSSDAFVRDMAARWQDQAGQAKP